MTKRLRTLLLLFGLSGGWLFAQESLVSPLDIPLFLSGNFGELRGGHFHSGIDIKTQERTGFAVRAVKSGYISRVNVSPSGYGNALYINHPDGTTSVYAHLNGFMPDIEKAVRDRQYKNESFAVQLYFTAAQFPVKQGEQVAWSGDSGSSGGPHLHFELRDTKTEKPFDPLSALMSQIPDTLAPQVRGVRLYPQRGTGVANGNVAWGKIGLGIEAYDRMNGQRNIYGIYELLLQVDSVPVYHVVMDSFSFDDTRYLNSYIDWLTWFENRSYYTKAFTEPGNRLRIRRLQNNGVIDVNEERTYHCEFILRDVYGNECRYPIDIVGQRQEIPPTAGKRFLYNQANTYSDKGIDLHIPKGNLYTDLYLSPDTVPSATAFSPVYQIRERAPLHSYCPLVLDVTKDNYPDKSKYGVVSYWKNEKTWLGGDYRNGKMYVKIRETGDFAVETDTLPPVIQPVNQTQWTSKQCLQFKISDDLSGIQSYRGTLDGRYALFEYDAKNQALSCRYDPQRMKSGSQTLLLTVKDAAGNKTSVKYTVKF